MDRAGWEKRRRYRLPLQRDAMSPCTTSEGALDLEPTNRFPQPVTWKSRVGLDPAQDHRADASFVLLARYLHRFAEVEFPFLTREDDN